MIRTIRLDNLQHRLWVVNGRIDKRHRKVERLERRVELSEEKASVLVKRGPSDDLRRVKSLIFNLREEINLEKNRLIEDTKTYLNLLSYLNFLNNSNLAEHPVLASVGGLKNKKVGVVFDSLLVFAQVSPSHSHFIFITPRGVVDLDSDDLEYGLSLMFAKFDLEDPQNPLLRERVDSLKEELGFCGVFVDKVLRNHVKNEKGKEGGKK